MNQKGFVNVILVLVVIAIAGAAAYFAYKNNLLTQPESPIDSVNMSGTDTKGLKIFRSDIFGLEIHYPEAVLVAQENALDVGRSDALYSREKINAQLSENFKNARYSLAWEYPPKAFQEGECKGNYVVGDVHVVTIDGVNVRGCKISITGVGQTTTRVIEYLYLEHPTTDARIRFTGRSDDVAKDRAVELFKMFEDAVGTLKFYKPSSKGLEIIEQIKGSGYAKPDQSQTARLQAEGRDGRRISQLNQLKNSMEFYHREFKDYPVSLTPTEIVRYKGNKEFDGTLNGIPVSEFHYFRCSKDSYHLGISLETNASLNNPKIIGLWNDLDAKSLCPADLIDGTDDQKCLPGDVGNYCYDLGPL